jgi:hypothetical protein
LEIFKYLKARGFDFFQNEGVFIRNLSDLTSQIVINAWWALMHVASTHPTAWNDSRHAPWGKFWLHCRIQQTGSPRIICIVCHQVLRHPSAHGTSSVGRLLLATVHITKANKIIEAVVTELTSSTLDETALAILKRPRSWGITIVSFQRKFIVDILVDPY